MPIYEYQCRKCGHRLEAMQKLSDRPLKRCPDCGGGLKKLISAPSIQFKGSGWYVTDYAGKKSEGPKEGAASESKTEGKGESKGESKGKAEGAAGETAGGASKRSTRSASGAG